jgi:hypothetical protein
MPSARRTPLTLAAALLLGVALGLAGPREKRRSNEAATVRPEGAVATVTDAGTAVPRAGEKSLSVPGSAAATSDAYADAWELLKDGTLSRQERRSTESNLLKEWAKVDLPAALEAAIRAASEGHWMDPDAYFVLSPLDACTEGIERQGDLVWDLIASREYGLHTRQLRKKWIHVFAEERPLEVLRRLPEMPPDVRAGAVLEAVATTHRLGQPAPGKEEVVAAVLAFRGTPDEAAVMQGYAGGIASVTESSELSALLLDPPDPAMREIYLMAYAMEIRMGSSASRQVGLGMLPPDLKAEVESRLDSAWSGIDGWFR